MLKPRKKGFSLVELLVVTIIMGIMGFMFIKAFYQNWLLFERQLARVNLQYRAEKVRLRFLRDASSAESVPPTGDDKTIIFTYPVALGRSDVTYQFLNNALVRQETPGVSEVLVDHVDALNSGFSTVSLPAVEMSLSLQDDIFGHRVDLDRKIAFLCRNMR